VQYLFNKSQRHFKNEMEKLQKEMNTKDVYICPTCKAKNVESQKYCINCGAWLLSTAYPAQKVIKPKSKVPPVIVSIVIIVLILIGLTNWNKTVTFTEMTMEDKYKITQLVIDRPLFKQPTATADFVALTATEMPLEVSAVFYDGAGTRLGKAISTIGTQLTKDQTTTLTLQFEGPAKLSKISSVRVEVTPLTPMMMLERAAKTGQNTSQ
jgi:hypothetical protein